MKSIKYFGMALIALLCTVGFSACTDDSGYGDLGLAIKVFSPTKVVTGQPVTINGSGFSDVTEVVFPGGIAVSDFERVSDEMIRVVTPAGINIAEGGEKLAVRTASEMAESPRLMTQGNTEVKSFSAEAGEDVKAKSILKVFGKDMEFVNKVTFIDKDDNTVELEQKDLFRIATNSVAIRIPDNIKEGKQVGTFETFDGKHFELPEYNYVAASSGHWETKKVMIWENPDPAGNGAVNWNGTYRFSNVETSTGEEIYAIPMDQWDVIKDGEFCFAFDGGADANVRITTGWWTGAYGGNEHNCIDFAEVDETTGLSVIKLNIKEEGSLYDNLDAQHLLFTGSGYTPMALYIEEQVWVEDEEGHWERKSLWKNDGTGGDINWNGTYRFANENTKTGEEIYAFSMDDWALIKDGKVRVAVETTEASNIRITTGWWTGAYGGTEHNCIDYVIEEADGTKYIELNIKEEGSLYDNLDAQHLLFTGSDYKLLEIYINEWVVDGAAKPVVIWENPDPDGYGAVNWNGVYRFSNEETVSGEQIYAIPMDQWDIVKNGTFYFVYDGGDDANVRITTGWWTGAYGGADHNCIDMAETDAATGLKVIKINIKEDGNLYDNLDAQHLLFTGSGYTPMKLYYVK